MIFCNRDGSILLLVMLFCAMLGLWSWHAWYRASVMHDSVLLSNAYYARWYKLNMILDCCTAQVMRHHDRFIDKLKKCKRLEIDYSDFYHSFDQLGSCDSHQLFLYVFLDTNSLNHLVLTLKLRDQSQTLFSVGHTIMKQVEGVKQKKHCCVVCFDYVCSAE